MDDRGHSRDGRMGWWIARRIGGISGDGHGAGIELTETALLLAMVAWR
jgi:adenosylcobinamide-GDP ribazoletransferase